MKHPERIIIAALLLVSLALGWAMGQLARDGYEVRQEGVMATPELFDSGLPRGETEILAKLYADAAERLKQMVLHPTGGEAASQESRQARAASLVRQIEAMRQQLGTQTALWIGTNVPIAFIDGLKRADKQASELLTRAQAVEKGVGTSFSLIDHPTVKVFARNIAGDLNAAAGGMTERAARLLRKTAQEGLSDNQINTILAGGVIEGKPTETTRTLRDELVRVHGKTVPVRDKNGNMMNFEADYYAEMVTRTQTREATTVARHERLEELGLDLVAIVGRLSGNFCTAFLGQVFSLSGTSDKYPAYSSLPGGGPPFHPNCSKSSRPFIDALASEEQLKLAKGLTDAGKLLEMKPAQAQRAFKDLQLFEQQTANYAPTMTKLFPRIEK